MTKVLANIGGLISAWVYLPKDAPHYTAANAWGFSLRMVEP